MSYAPTPQIDWFKENPQMAVYLSSQILQQVIYDRLHHPFSMLRQRYRKSVITA